MLLHELVDQKSFTVGFHQTRKMDGTEYTLIADCVKQPGTENPALVITAIDQDMETVGKVIFQIKRGMLMLNKHIEAYKVFVHDDHRRKGIATAMYKFASDLGNTIKPSSMHQTNDGKSLWKGFKG